MKFRVLFFLTILLGSAGCKKEKDVSSSLLDYIPKNAAIIFKINDHAAFKSELKNNDFLKDIGQTELYGSLLKKIKCLDYVNPKSKGTLAFSELGKENFEFIYATPAFTSLFQLDHLKDTSVETIIYENKKIDKYVIDDAVLYAITMDNNTVASSSQLLLENLIRNAGRVETDPTLKRLYTIANTGKSASVIINAKKSNALISHILKENTESDVTTLTDWISFDLDMGQDYINLNGISIADNPLKNYINLFKNTQPLANTTPSFAPVHADAFLCYTFDDYDIFAKNQREYLDRSTVTDTLFNTVEEIGFIYMNTQKVIVLNTYGSENLSQFLNGLKKSSFNYQGNEIIELTSTDFLNTSFDPIIKKFTANYCSILENAFVFSTDKESLQTIISNFKNGSTYNRTPVFETVKEVMADESSILFVSNSNGMEHILTENFSAAFSKDLKNPTLSKYAFGVQVVADKNFYHTNIVIKKIEKEIKNNTTSPLFNVQLDSDIATQPQFVVNHRTNKKEIVVQDQDNHLYLISTEGKVLWKKQLEGRVQGKIEQVDIYKNGRLQLAFATDNQFLILDRNGKEVLPFAKKYEGGNLNPLAIFDYDGKKDYRFVVTQGNKVYMYNNRGNIVDGFKYTMAGSPIMSAPQHFRKGRKDYLVFKLENGDLKILNRIGNVRINVPGKIDFSENDIYLYKGKFTVTDKNGTLYQINENAKLSKTNFNLNKDHGMGATSKTLVLMNDNVLIIKGKKVELDLGVYTKPKIFYLYDKIYVSVTDIQNQKIYLFDSNAKPIQNFPVFGASQIDLDDMDNDRKLELVAKDLDNSLIVYKMN